MSEDYICKRLSGETICQDLQVLILKRLPVKTLLRCRCVCKWWKEIFASKWFVLDHLAIQRPRLIAQNTSTNYLLFDTRTLPSCDNLSCPDQFLFLSGIHPFVVVGGVHGVMCLYNNADRLFLWNPLTRQSLRIPLGGLWVCREQIGRKYCGFWIDPSNNDFKIVIFKFRPHIRATLFWSRKPGAWTEVDAGGIHGCIGTFASLQVLIGGVAHWLAYSDDDRIILFFDFRQDKFGTIELPEPSLLSKSPRNVKLCKWQDSLSVVHWKTFRPYRFDMWALQNDGSWSKMFSFNLIKGIREVHCVLEDWGRLVVSDYDIFSKEMLYYDPREGCMTPLESKFGKAGAPFVAFEFVESLVFPDPKCISF